MNTFLNLLILTTSSLCYGETFIADSLKPLSVDMVNAINSQATTWKAGNNFGSTSVEVLKGRLGVHPDNDKYRLAEIKHVSSTVTIPASFDARTQWPACTTIGLIHDQGQCGSCWAFATAEAISDRLCIAKSGAVNVQVSAQDLLSCCGSYCGYGCNGGYPNKAWAYWVSKGLCTGGDYNTNIGCKPYTINPALNNVVTPRCTGVCITNSINYAGDKRFGLSAYSIANNVAQIQTEIMSYGPVEATFNVYNDFFNYKSGVYKRISNVLAGGHAVKIIGWGTENGVDYWLVANSWSTSWGDKGFFKIRRGTNECGFEAGISAGRSK